MHKSLILISFLSTLTLTRETFAGDLIKVGTCPTNSQFIKVTENDIDKDNGAPVTDIQFANLKEAVMLAGRIISCSYEGGSLAGLLVDEKYSFRTCVFNNTKKKKRCTEDECSVWCELKPS